MGTVEFAVTIGRDARGLFTDIVETSGCTSPFAPFRVGPAGLEMARPRHTWTLPPSMREPPGIPWSREGGDVSTMSVPMRLESEVDPSYSMKIIAGSCGSSSFLWNADWTGQPVELKGNDNWVGAVAFSADGKKVLTGSIAGLAGAGAECGRDGTACDLCRKELRWPRRVLARTQR